MATKQYTKGLQKLLAPRVDPDTGDDLLPETFVDLLGDDLCFALVNVDVLDDDGGGAYTVDHHVHEYLSDVVGVGNGPVWVSGAEPSFITKHSVPLSLKTLTVVPAIVGPGSEVKFDCDDETLSQVPDEAPKSEAIVLYKRVLVDPLLDPDPNNPVNIALDKSPLIAYFDGASVALDPNGNDVEVVISGNGLMRWGIGA